MARPGPLSDLSGLQLVAGALAAMTSAWMASWLGVAGTLIGAAVGSVVAGIATALYRSSLERGIRRSKTLLVTEQGSVVQQAPDSDESLVAAGDAGQDPDGGAASWKERLRRLNWRSVAIISGITLLIAVAVIAVYEVSTGDSYGNSSNSRIVPVGASRGGDGGQQTPGPGETAPTVENPTQSAPTEDSSTTPEPTTSAPTTAAPTTEAPAQPQAPEGGESPQAP